MKNQSKTALIHPSSFILHPSQARVLILYNEPVLPAGHPDFESEHEVLHTLEFVARTLTEARFGVTRLGLSNVELRIANGYHGWSEHAPFDKVMVAAAPIFARS